MRRKIDYSTIPGTKFGKLTVIEQVGKTPRHGPLFRCKCECGNEKIIQGHSLVSGLSQSCGCMRHRKVDYQDLIGQRFGKLVVMEYVGLITTGKNRNESAYRCKCDCGNEVIIPREQLICNKRVSCGECYRIVWEGSCYRYITADGGSFIFDREDYDRIADRKWSISPYGYARGRDKQKNIRLSRWLLNVPPGHIVDHINGDRLDYRRQNLRVATTADNNRNSAIQRNNTSGYKGVCFQHSKYQATVYVDGKGIYLGRYDNPEDAARAYDEAARFYYGEFACVNFPLPGEQGCHRKQEDLKKGIVA